MKTCTSCFASQLRRFLAYKIAFGSGFSVAAGGTLSAVVDPSLLP